jgi:hypothetical protein
MSLPRDGYFGGVTAFLCCGLTALLICAITSIPINAQTATRSGTAVHHYLGVQFFQPGASGSFVVLGPRFDTPEHARLVLTGTLTIGTGSPIPVVVTRQLDEAVRIDLSGPNPRTIVANGLTGAPATSAGLSASDYNLLEIVANDTPEGFLYGFQDGAGIRFLGSRFRTDSGTDPNYTGPFYDIYESRGPASAASGQPSRRKLYYFDSVTRLLAIVSYEAQGGSQPVNVAIVYTNWQSVGGLKLPGQICRIENGAQTLSFSFQSAQVSALASDNEFNP